MKVFKKYEVLPVSTARGYAIQITTTFSTFDGEEFEQLKEQFEQFIHAGVEYELGNQFKEQK